MVSNTRNLIFLIMMNSISFIKFADTSADCTPAFLGAIGLFSQGQTGTVMVVIASTPTSVTADCNMGLLARATVPMEVVTSSKVKDINFFPRKLIIILPEDLESHQFEMFFRQINMISVMNNIVFIATNHNMNNFKILTGYFAHSMIMQANPDFTVTSYIRPNLFEDELEVSTTQNVDLKQIGEFDHITTDFHGHTIRAVGFDLKPYFVPDFDNPENHAGYEYNIAAAIFNSLNLNMVVYKPTGPNGWWGKEDPPGSGNYTGLFGDLQRGVAEIGWANLYSTEERKSFMDFTDWYLVEPACILMKRPKARSGLHILILPLDEAVWLFTGICLVILGSLYLLQYVLKPDIAPSWGYLLFYGAAIALRESDPYTHSPKQTNSLRLAHLLFIPCLLVLSSAYSGSLVSFLSIDVFPPPPQTYDQVAKEVIKKDLRVALCCTEIKDVFRKSELESFQEFYRRSYYPQGWDTGFIRASEGTDIYLYTENALEITRRTNTYRVPYDSMYVMKECFLPINIALGLKRQSPIKDAINLKLKQLREAGVISKMVKDGHNIMANAAQVSVQGTREISKDKPLDLKHLQGVFQVLLMALALALLIFVVEFIKNLLNKSSLKSGSPKLEEKEQNRRRKNYKKKSVFLPSTYRRGKNRRKSSAVDNLIDNDNNLQHIFGGHNSNSHDLQKVLTRTNSSSNNLKQVVSRRNSNMN